MGPPETILQENDELKREAGGKSPTGTDVRSVWGAVRTRARTVTLDTGRTGKTLESALWEKEQSWATV